MVSLWSLNSVGLLLLQNYSVSACCGVSVNRLILCFTPCFPALLGSY